VRRRLGFVFAFLFSVAGVARESDEIQWVGMNGTPGWSSAIPTSSQPAGVVPTPLIAPTWFAKFPDAKVDLAPEGTFDLASARGKVLLVDYWASWCGPCLKELPHLQRLHVARSGDGLVALAINMDEDAVRAADSAKRLGLTMPIGLNKADTYLALGVRTLPSLFAVDKQGRLRARWDGYKVGIETEIAATVDKLLADDTSGTTKPIASVVSGPGVLQARWYRDLTGTADGVLGLPAGAVGLARVVASGGDQLVSFDAAGEVVARVKTGSAPGRLLDFGTTADGTREVAGFRPGGTTVSVVALRSGAERTIAIPAPMLDVVVVSDAAGGGRRLVTATMNGAASAAAGDAKATLLPEASSVRSLATVSGGGIVTLSENGSIAPLADPKKVWPHRAEGAERLLVAREDGAVTATRSVTAAASGTFLPGGGRQLAVATYAGHVALIDEATGRVLFDALWAAVHDLAAVDLDGDGLDELLVASGRSVAVLGAPGR
jgi:thiol-disulfide isomerase/thioredoxin